LQDVIEKLKTDAGLTQEQAIKAVEVMKDYIQAMVPPMFSGFVDKFFAKNSNNAQPPDDNPLSF